MFVGRRDGAGAADGDPDPDRDGRVRPRDRLRPAAGRARLQCLRRRPVRQGIPRRTARRDVRRDDAAAAATARALRRRLLRDARAGARARRGRDGRSSSPAIASAASARSTSPAAAPTLPAAVSFHGLFDPPGLPAAEDQGQGRRLPRLGRSDGPAGQGRRAGPGADRGRRRLADPRLRPCRPRLHQPARAASSQIDGVAYNALAAERSWTSFINLLEELFGCAWLRRADRGRGRQPADAAGEGDRAARQALSRPGRAGDFRRRL